MDVKCKARIAMKLVRNSLDLKKDLRSFGVIILGKRANQIGPLAVFRELVEKADENLLAAGNYTQCPTIEAIKKAGFDYGKKMRIDEDIFKECRIISYSYKKSDVTSTDVQGEL